MPALSASSFFISHASADKPWVRTLESELAALSRANALGKQAFIIFTAIESAYTSKVRPSLELWRSGEKGEGRKRLSKKNP